MRTLFIGLVFCSIFHQTNSKYCIESRKNGQQAWKTHTHTSEHMAHSRLIKSCRRVVVSLFDMWMNWPPSQFTWSNRIHIERWIYLLFFCSNYKWHLQHLNALHHFWCQIVNISLCWIETIQQRRQLVYSVCVFFLYCFPSCAVCIVHTPWNELIEELFDQKLCIWIWNGLFEGGYESNNFSFAEKFWKKHQ